MSPRSPTSTLVCSPPTPCLLRPWLRFPLPTAYLAAGASSVPRGPTTRALANVSCVGDGSPALRKTGMGRGAARSPPVKPGDYWAVLFVRAMVEHPAGYAPLLAHLTERLLWPSGNSAPWASGKVRGFGAATPGPTRSHASASPRPFLTRRKACYRRGRAHPSPGGFRTPWTTHKVSWSYYRLQFPLTHRAWSH